MFRSGYFLPEADGRVPRLRRESPIRVAITPGRLLQAIPGFQGNPLGIIDREEDTE